MMRANNDPFNFSDIKFKESLTLNKGKVQYPKKELEPHLRRNSFLAISLQGRIFTYLKVLFLPFSFILYFSQLRLLLLPTLTVKLVSNK